MSAERAESLVWWRIDLGVERIRTARTVRSSMIKGTNRGMCCARCAEETPYLTIGVGQLCLRNTRHRDSSQ